MQDGNKECFDKINALRDKKPTPIFLSAVSLKHCNRAYEQVIFDGTQLVVIDGLHRLVGWALHLNDDIEFGSVPVTTFIASPSTDVRSMSVLKCFSKFC
ncbi:hypothetical protein JW824_05060 [bacterium]|nr:hypothetical protein [bacterium]